MRLNAVKLHSVQSINAKFSPAKNSAPKAQATQNPLKELSSIPTNKALAQMGNISFGDREDFSEKDKNLYREICRYIKKVEDLYKQKYSISKNDNATAEQYDSNHIDDLLELYEQDIIDTVRQISSVEYKYEVVDKISPYFPDAADIIIDAVPAYLVKNITVDDYKIQAEVKKYVNDIQNSYPKEAIETCKKLAKICKSQGLEQELINTEKAMKLLFKKVGNEGKYLVLKSIEEYDPEVAKDLDYSGPAYFKPALFAKYWGGIPGSTIYNWMDELDKDYEAKDYLGALRAQLALEDMAKTGAGNYDKKPEDNQKFNDAIKNIYKKLPKYQRQEGMEMIKEKKERLIKWHSGAIEGFNICPDKEILEEELKEQNKCLDGIKQAIFIAKNSMGKTVYACDNFLKALYDCTPIEKQQEAKELIKEYNPELADELEDII